VELVSPYVYGTRPEGGVRKYEYKALAPETREFGYEKAEQTALAWFQGGDAGVTDDALAPPPVRAKAASTRGASAESRFVGPGDPVEEPAGSEDRGRLCPIPGHASGSSDSTELTVRAWNSEAPQLNGLHARRRSPEQKTPTLGWGRSFE
jgi:hypothetical protein